MIKKSLLVMALFGSQVSKPKDSDVVLGMTAAIVVGGVLTYAVAYRESNESKIARIEEVHSWFKKSQAIHALYDIDTVADMQQYLKIASIGQIQELRFHAELVEVLYNSMNARYNSWFKPWNWNKSMKEAFGTIAKMHTVTKLFTLMMKYARFIPLCNTAYDQNVVMQNVQLLSQGAAMYPMITCSNIVKQDLSWLKRVNFGFTMFDTALIEVLEHVLIMVVSHPTYTQEKQHQEEMRIKQEAALAAQRQAEAQAAQAAAQAEQARATRERNRIEQERLEHEKRRDQW